MKKTFCLAAFVLLVVFGCTASSKREVTSYGDSKIDVLFSNYFDALQRLNDGSGTDFTDEEVREIIEFLSRVTQIKPKLDDTFTVVSGVTQTSLEEWKNWYYNNQDSLSWTELNKLLKKVKKEIK